MFINFALTDAFEAKVTKLSRRAIKMGMEPVMFQYGNIIEKSCSSMAAGAFLTKDGWKALYIEVTFLNEAPVMNGYKFVAVVDLMGQNPVVRRQPWASTTDLSAYFHTDGHCDHCNTTRQRNDVLIVENVETGHLMQVGRNCAADFFRCKFAENVIRVSDYETSLDINDSNDWGHSKNFQPIVPLKHLFETAAAVVRTFGWVDMKMAERDVLLESTRGRIHNNLFPYVRMPKEEMVVVLDADVLVAENVMAWLDAEWLSVPANNEFQQSVKAVVEVSNDVQYVRRKNMNYLIWMINGYLVDLEKKATESKRKSVTALSDFVGSPGDRIEVDLTLKFRRVYGGTYGETALCKFTDAAGNTLVWRGTSPAAFQMVLDVLYTVKATVKDHTVYGGDKQTDLTRLTVLKGQLEEEA